MKPLITVIIPVHNVEKHLSQCIKSVLGQSLKNIEVIAVDDGSTDSSGHILDQYAAEDIRLKVIHKDNEGVSEARNEALKHAKGEYTAFVDSDDWIDAEMLEDMYNHAVAYNSEIVMCGYIREFEEHSKVKHMGLKNGVIMDKKEVQDCFIRRMIGPVNGELYITENLDMHSVVWNKLYKTRVIKGIEFRSLKEIGSCEDLLFNLAAFYNANSILFIEKHYYHYRKILSNSVSNSYKPDLITKRLNLIKSIRKFIDSNSTKETYYEALNNRICLGTMGMGLNILSSGNKSGTSNKIRQIGELLSNNDIANAFQEFNFSGLPVHWRIFYFFAKTRNSICYLLMLKAIKFMIVFSR